MNLNYMPLKFEVIVLAALLLTGLALVPVLDLKVDAQSIDPAQLKSHVMKATPGQMSSEIANAVAKGYPGIDVKKVQNLVQQLSLQTAKDFGQEKALGELRQLTYQVLLNPKGIAASALAVHAKQISSNVGNTPEKVVQEIHKVSNSGGGGGGGDKGSGGGGQSKVANAPGKKEAPSRSNPSTGSNTGVSLDIIGKMVKNIINKCGAKCSTDIENLVNKVITSSGGKFNKDAEAVRNLVHNLVLGAAAKKPAGNVVEEDIGIIQSAIANPEIASNLGTIAVASEISADPYATLPPPGADGIIETLTTDLAAAQPITFEDQAAANQISLTDTDALLAAESGFSEIMTVDVSTDPVLENIGLGGFSFDEVTGEGYFGYPFEDLSGTEEGVGFEDFSGQEFSQGWIFEGEEALGIEDEYVAEGEEELACDEEEYVDEGEEELACDEEEYVDESEEDLSYDEEEYVDESEEDLSYDEEEYVDEEEEEEEDEYLEDDSEEGYW